MAAEDQLTQTQEKLQTNGDTDSPTDSNVHLISLDQKETEGYKEPIPSRKLS